MICNRCVKQDVCIHKMSTEMAEGDMTHNNPNIIIDCKHREPATSAQMEKIRRAEA